MTLTLLRKKRIWVGLAIVSCLIVLITHLPMGLLLANAHGWLSSQGIWAIPTFIVLYVVVAVFGLPNIVLILAAGPLFGLVQGVISASVADTLSIAACFVIGQTVGRRWLTRTIKENSRFHKLDSAFAQKGWRIVLLTRLSPLLPSNILNYGFSLTCIDFWEYLFFSWLGMLPVIFTYVYVGTFGVNIVTANQQTENLIFQAIGLVATLGVMIYTTKLATLALRTDDSDAHFTAPKNSPEAFQNVSQRRTNPSPSHYLVSDKGLRAWRKVVSDRTATLPAPENPEKETILRKIPINR